MLSVKMQTLIQCIMSLHHNIKYHCSGWIYIVGHVNRETRNLTQSTLLVSQQGLAAPMRYCRWINACSFVPLKQSNLLLVALLLC